MGKRLNIGLLVDDLDAVFTSQAVKGAELGAIAIDANMFIFPGMYLDSVNMLDDHNKYEYQFNSLFKYVNKNKIDVLYIMMGMIGARASEKEQLKFLEQYLGIPIVTLYTKKEGYQSIIFDNKIAFKEGIKHLIEDHGAKRVGYVSGPKTNVDAMERLEAYKESLEETGLSFDEDLVVYGNFEESSEGLISEFVQSKDELDALVFANDRMAQGGYRALKKLDIQVGRDLLVVSFDNSEFAAGLNPPLTTVEANAAELSYKAIIRAEQFVRTGEMGDIKVDTHLIRRSSCGCLGFNYHTISEQIGISNLLYTENVDLAIENIHRYLFSNYVDGIVIRGIRSTVDRFVRTLLQIREVRDYEGIAKELSLIFAHLTTYPLYRYTTVELLTNVLKSLQFEYRMYLNDKDLLLLLSDMFSDFYRVIAVLNWQSMQGRTLAMDRMTKRVNLMMEGIYRIDSGEQIPYENALENIGGLGMKAAYLYSFVQPIHLEREDEFVCPEKLMLRAYYRKEATHGVPENEQLLPVDHIYDNKYMPKDRRSTIVFMPLFSGTEMFGLVACDVHYEYFRNIETFVMQLSLTLKSMMLLEQQVKVQKNLELNLQQMSENNNMLKQISRTDQLTGLLNRWGFVDRVNEMVEDPANRGKKAFVVFADMDNLKMINDKFGHDDGDFALKAMGATFRECFPNNAAISRYGGDEFVVFMIGDRMDTEQSIKKHIVEVTDRLNKGAHKEYKIYMSVGVAECECSTAISLFEVLAVADAKLYQEKREKKRRAALQAE